MTPPEVACSWYEIVSPRVRLVNEEGDDLAVVGRSCGQEFID